MKSCRNGVDQFVEGQVSALQITQRLLSERLATSRSKVTKAQLSAIVQELQQLILELRSRQPEAT